MSESRDRSVIFMEGLRNIGCMLVALCEDWLAVPHDRSSLANRRGKVAKQGAVGLHFCREVKKEN